MRLLFKKSRNLDLLPMEYQKQEILCYLGSDNNHCLSKTRIPKICWKNDPISGYEIEVNLYLGVDNRTFRPTHCH